MHELVFGLFVGLLIGAALVSLGVSLQKDRPATVLPPRTPFYQRDDNANGEAVNATVPYPTMTSAPLTDFTPVYLTDSDIVAMERMASGKDARAAHEPIQAERRGA